MLLCNHALHTDTPSSVELLNTNSQRESQGSVAQVVPGSLKDGLQVGVPEHLAVVLVAFLTPTLRLAIL